MGIRALKRKTGTGTARRERGAVFTRGEVAEFILDLVGYDPALPLWRRRILEPSFGDGAFLFPAIGRLLRSWRCHDRFQGLVESELENALRGVELHEETFDKTQKRVVETLENEGVPHRIAKRLADRWLVRNDFLLMPQKKRSFDFVVGNPPYVRYERIPAELLAEYRQRHKTMQGRTDLYIPFFERALSLLAPGGALGFLSPDRWMKNLYGASLRELVSTRYHLKTCVDMAKCGVFQSDVGVYPVVSVIENAKRDAKRSRNTRFVACPWFEEKVSLAAGVESGDRQEEREIRELRIEGRDPWLVDEPERVALVRRIRDRFPSMEWSGCRVGLGVATGADVVFVGDFESLDVEPDRKLQLAEPSDIANNTIEWQGRGLVNPFGPDGRLVELRNFPRLAERLERNRTILSNRYCAKKAPDNWYRTIDRIDPKLAATPKLFVPRIFTEPKAAVDEGRFYPQNSVFYILSQDWDLEALRTLFLSNVVLFFLWVGSMKIRGGSIILHAQDLRNIRLPLWKDVPNELKDKLLSVGTNGGRTVYDEAAFELYGLAARERSIVGRFLEDREKRYRRKRTEE